MNPADMCSDPETALREQRAFEERMGVEERYRTKATDDDVVNALRSRKAPGYPVVEDARRLSEEQRRRNALRYL